MENKIYIPTKDVDSWKELLANPEKQWETGFSAKAIAYCWESNKNNFPTEIDESLKNSGLNLDVLFAIPEYKVTLDNGKAPSQNDLFILSKNKDLNELVVIMVEGKVNEPFDNPIEKWYLDESNGKKNRFEFLAEKLEIDESISKYNKLRYQLFHRTVSAILTAEKFCAKKAVMIIHSFSPKNKWHNDYLEFVKMLNPNPNISEEVGTIERCKTLKSGIELYIGWIKGNEKYLKM